MMLIVEHLAEIQIQIKTVRLSCSISMYIGSIQKVIKIITYIPLFGDNFTEA